MKIHPSPYRTFNPPKSKPWVYYQEWNKALFLHYPVPKEVLLPYIPSGLSLDSFNGVYWISLVAFTMNNIKPRFVPSISFISNFHEINLRTYVKYENKPGVYFLSIEGEKSISNFIAKVLSGLPYEKANIRREENIYQSHNSSNGNYLNTEFIIGDYSIKDPLDIWLTERYALYLNEGKKLFRYEIDHNEWEIKSAYLKQIDINYKINDFILSNPAKIHYSPGVKVIAWSRDRLNKVI